MRLSPINLAAGKLLDFSLADDVQRHARGTLTAAVGTDYDTTSNVANWGFCEVMYVSSAHSAAIIPGTVCVMDKNWRIVPTAVAATEAGTGKPLYIALTNFPIGSTTEQFGWVLVSGICPVRFSVAATVGAVHAGTAGVWTPTASAGSGIQIMNAQTIIAAVSTFTRSVTTRNGSSRLKVASVAGYYPGQAISGTGIPGSSVISSVDPSGNEIVIGSAVGTPVNATATGTVTATSTNTGYGIVLVSRPHMQGYIV